MTAALTELEPSTLQTWLNSGQATLIDVREADEFAAEHIPGARLTPLSRFNPASLIGRDSGRLVMQCKSGKRAAEACARILNAGASEVFTLKGGIEAWKAAGLPIERSASAPRLTIMRQVQLVVGVSVLAGSILAWLVSPLFLLLTGFFGAGLAFAGATGTCALASILGFMPWNKGLRCGRGASCSA